MRDTTLTVLLWCLPLAMTLHVIEEFAFPASLLQWIRTYKPRKPKSNVYYFLINAAAIAFTILIALLPTDAGVSRAYLAFTAAMAGNAVSHIRATIQKKEYCPGAISGALLFLPLLGVSGWYLLSTGKIDWLSATLNCLVGIFLGFYVFGIDIRKADRPARPAAKQMVAQT